LCIGERIEELVRGGNPAFASSEAMGDDEAVKSALRGLLLIRAPQVDSLGPRL
jgi:hypothetical protein